MSGDKRKILVDKDLRPAYYDDFHCIMGACRYNCCDDNWRIEFDKRDYLAIKQAPKSGEMEELARRCVGRLRERGHDGLYAEFHPDGDLGRCAFHTPEGLCRLQLECGAEVLPRVCRVYPRSEAYMLSGFLERSLSPSCEAVLELLWNLPEGVEFRSDPLPKAEQKHAWSNVEGPMPYWFSVVREWCVDRLQDRRLPLAERILLMGLGLKELAEGEADLDRWMARAALLPEQADVSGLLPKGEQELTLFLSDCMELLLSVQSTNPNLQSVPQELAEAMELELREERNLFSVTAYQKARARYGERFRDREYFLENLMVTIFYYLRFPQMDTPEKLWKSYVNFCNLYAFYRFLAVMSCREGVEDSKAELFRLTVFASRALIHNRNRQNLLRDELFQNDSATLAHMAILVGG